jgi:hypothetical protein
MPEFVWNEYEFIECLGVLPEVNEYDASHTFKVERHGLRLELNVSQYDGDIFLHIFREGIETPIFAMRLIDCAGARYVRDKHSDFLEFAPAECFWRSSRGRYDRELSVPFGFRVSVNPHIKIEPFSE